MIRTTADSGNQERKCKNSQSIQSKGGHWQVKTQFHYGKTGIMKAPSRAHPIYVGASERSLRDRDLYRENWRMNRRWPRAGAVKEASNSSR